MNITRNSRALALYSGTLGAFLQSSNHSQNQGHDQEHLERCRQWLIRHNPTFRKWSFGIVSYPTHISPYPTVELICEPHVEIRSLNRPKIVIDPLNLAQEMANEDHRSFCPPQAVLANTDLHILRSDPELELLLFLCFILGVVDSGCGINLHNLGRLSNQLAGWMLEGR